MKPELQDEARRIRTEYERRQRDVAADFYALHKPANLFIKHGQERTLAAALRDAELLPLAERKILEIGCGYGQWLATFEEFGASRESLFGIDLKPEFAAACAQRFVGADIRTGDAAELPWPDATFDMVLQATVFTSILDDKFKRAVAAEMLRVLRPGGCVIWYDFLVNNPNNPHVRGIGRNEIAELFPDCDVRLRRITLAPPLARRLAGISWTLAHLLEKLRVFNTHYLGMLRKPR